MLDKSNIAVFANPTGVDATDIPYGIRDSVQIWTGNKRSKYRPYISGDVKIIFATSGVLLCGTNTCEGVCGHLHGVGVTIIEEATQISFQALFGLVGNAAIREHIIFAGDPEHIIFAGDPCRIGNYLSTADGYGGICCRK